MKTLKLSCLFALAISAASVSAQKKADLDNNAHVTVVRTEKMTGRVKEIHYVMTNISGVSMDFSLYTQLNNGNWDVTHHLDLSPGATYEDVSGFTAVTGKYVLFSAPHSDWASFPSQFDIPKVLASNPATAALVTTPTTKPATTTTPTNTTIPTTTPPATKTTKKIKTTSTSSSDNPTPPKDDSAPPVPPPM